MNIPTKAICQWTSILVIPINEHPIFGITKSALTHSLVPRPLFCQRFQLSRCRGHSPAFAKFNTDGETVASSQTMKLPVGEIPMDSLTFGYNKTDRMLCSPTRKMTVPTATPVFAKPGVCRQQLLRLIWSFFRGLGVICSLMKIYILQFVFTIKPS